jgi:hypothetical protein
MLTVWYELFGRMYRADLWYRVLTARAWLQSLVNPCAICDDRVAQGQVFDRLFQHQSINVPFSSSSTCWSYQKDKRAKTGNRHKAMLFQKSGSVGLLNTLLHVARRGRVVSWLRRLVAGTDHLVWSPISSLCQSTLDFCWSEQHRTGFCLYCYFSTSVSFYDCYTLSTSYRLYSQQHLPTELMFSSKEKIITFLALKSVYAFGNRYI